MNRPSLPLLGFNNNVRHNGRVFHIQTEDSGIRYCRVVTHLFADGGRILRTSRTDYSQQKDEPDVTEQIRRLMKEQHRSMFAALRSGDFDEIISDTFEGAKQAELETSECPASQPFQLRSQEFPALSLPAPEDRSEAAPPALASMLDQRPSNRPKLSSRAPAKIGARGDETLDSVRIPAPNYADTLPAVSTPALRLSRPPLESSENGRHESTRSLFGDAPASEQSLGDVIRSYVEDAVDKGSG